MIDPRTVPVRFTNLKRIAKSPAHYFASVQEHRDDDNLARRIGRGVHAMLLDTPFVVWTGKVRSGKKWDAFRTEHDGQEILNQSEYDTSRRIADAVLGNATACSILFADDAVLEQAIDWSFMGRACRSRPDSRAPGRVVDLKKCRSAEPASFVRQGSWLGYHAQLGFYQEAIRSAGLDSCDDCYIVAVEEGPPSPVTVFEVEKETIELGRRLYHVWFEQLLVCEAAGVYPAYAQDIVPFRVEPPLELTVDGDALEMEGF